MLFRSALEGVCFLVGAPAFMWGKGALQRPGRRSVLITRFSAGNPAAKAHLKIKSISAGLKSSFPLLKQGASTPKVFHKLLRSLPSPPSPRISGDRAARGWAAVRLLSGPDRKST